MCTKDQYPHVVTLCTVYASVTNFERRIATWSDSVRTFPYTDDFTDGYGYGDKEIRQHDIMS